MSVLKSMRRMLSLRWAKIASRTRRRSPHFSLDYSGMVTRMPSQMQPILFGALSQRTPSSQEKIAKAGPTSDLIALLKEGTDEAKEYALWSLSLSINEGNQSVLLDEQGIEPLVTALNSTNIKTRQQAAAALAALAHDNEKAQTMVAKAGSIVPLIQIVKIITNNDQSAIAAREYAAAALAQLAYVSENRDEVVDAGGIEPLVKLLHEGEPMSQRFAAAAIARLATNHLENAATIAKAGAIPSLVNLLSGERGEEAQEEAAGALFELADDAGNRISITEAGGIGPLVTLLGSSNHKARRHAERVFVRLSIESANRVIIIEKLVGMLNDDGKSAQEQAAAALANLASDSAENRFSIVDAGGIIPLLSLLGDSSHKAKENAVSAIAKLALKSPDIQMAIQKAGVFPCWRTYSYSLPLMPKIKARRSCVLSRQAPFRRCLRATK